MVEIYPTPGSLSIRVWGERKGKKKGGVLPGGGGGGGGLGSYFARMCVSKGEGHGFLFWLQGSEMSEIISLRLGVRYAVSRSMVRNEFMLSIEYSCI